LLSLVGEAEEEVITPQVEAAAQVAYGIQHLLLLL
jgi:hypothetical protein